MTTAPLVPYPVPNLITSTNDTRTCLCVNIQNTTIIIKLDCGLNEECTAANCMPCIKDYVKRQKKYKRITNGPMHEKELEDICGISHKTFKILDKLQVTAQRFYEEFLKCYKDIAVWISWMRQYQPSTSSTNTRNAIMAYFCLLHYYEAACQQTFCNYTVSTNALPNNTYGYRYIRGSIDCEEWPYHENDWDYNDYEDYLDYYDYEEDSDYHYEEDREDDVYNDFVSSMQNLSFR